MHRFQIVWSNLRVLRIFRWNWWDIREQFAGTLSMARCHKMSGRYDEALLAVEDALAKDPEFPEALFIKAQILLQGFEAISEANQCLIKVMKTEKDPDATLHRWARNLYDDITKG